jgi:transcriptional enhancer factor
MDQSQRSQHTTTLSSQKFSPSSDFTYDRRKSTFNTRQPLGESTGNAKSHQELPLALCQQSPSTRALSSSMAHTVPAPVLLSQEYGAGYGGGLRARRESIRLQRRPRYGINPIYLSPQFIQYRDKQEGKDDKDAHVWPPVLEDAFLDGTP